MVLDAKYFDNTTFTQDLVQLEHMYFEVYETIVVGNHYYKKTNLNEILTESFSDTIGKIKDYFDAIIKKISEFFKKVMTYINSFLMDLSDFVKKYKSKISEISFKPFTIQGYNYTNLSSSPSLNPFNDIVASYNTEISDLSKLDKDDIKDRYVKYFEDNNIEKIYGVILGSKSNISNDDLIEEARKYFRNDESAPIEIEVDEAYVSKILSQVSFLEKEKLESIKLRNDLIKLFEQTKKFFSDKLTVLYKSSNDKHVSITSLNIEGTKLNKDSNIVNYTDKLYIALNELCHYKYEQASKIGTATTTVLTERVNAYKENLRQYRDILRKVLFAKNDDKE